MAGQNRAIAERVEGQMKRGKVPAAALAKLTELSEAATYLSDKVIRLEQGIASARQRLTGSLADRDYTDTRHTLEQMVNDLPALQRKCGIAESTYEKCKEWLDGLSDGVILEPADTKARGTLDEVRSKIKALEKEHDVLAAALSRSEVEEKFREYVHGLAKPTITGLGREEKLRVLWPGCGWDQRGPLEHHAEVLPVMALFEPDKMIAGLMRMVKIDERPPYERAKRSGALRGQLEELRYVEEVLVQATGAERSPDAPPQAILGVRYAREAMASERDARVKERVPSRAA
jgi:hypothetical protein